MRGPVGDAQPRARQVARHLQCYHTRLRCALLCRHLQPRPPPTSESRAAGGVVVHRCCTTLTTGTQGTGATQSRTPKTLPGNKGYGEGLRATGTCAYAWFFGRRESKRKKGGYDWGAYQSLCVAAHRVFFPMTAVNTPTSPPAVCTTAARRK